MKILLLVMFLGICHGAPFSSPCTEDEMLQPITDFNRIIDELKSPGVDQEHKLEEIMDTIVSDAENFVKKINTTCGDEKDALEEKLEKFYKDVVLGPARIMLEIATNDLDNAKDLLQAVNSKHMLQYFITVIYSKLKELDNIIEIVKLMDDPEKINNVHEAIIYSLNSKNINDGKLLVPILKDHIVANANNAEIVKNAKLNLKTLAERTSSHYPDAVNALNEVE